VRVYILCDPLKMMMFGQKPEEAKRCEGGGKNVVILSDLKSEPALSLNTYLEEDDDGSAFKTRTSRAMSCDTWDSVRVVVGGSVFITSVTTLTSRDRESVFHEQLNARSLAHIATPPSSRRWSALPPPNHVPQLEFNRNPKLFLVILNYLRTGRLTDPKMSSSALLTVRAEAEFYRCHGLIKQLDMLAQSKKEHENKKKVHHHCSSAQLSPSSARCPDDRAWGLFDGLGPSTEEQDSASDESGDNCDEEDNQNKDDDNELVFPLMI
jgi:hypothetical protein